MAALNEQEEFEFRLRMEQEGQQPAQPPAQQELGWLAGWNRRMGQTIANVGAGALRGAGSIGATILSPLDYAGVTGMTNEQRRAAMDEGLRSMGADPESLAYGGGKLAGEIAGTAGVGGVLAKSVGLVSQTPRAAALANALRTGGFSTGAPAAKALSAEGVKNALTRIGGGAVSGGAMAGAINPEEAGTGAVLGGAMPVAVQGAGKIGSAIASKMKISPEKAQLALRAKELGIDIPADRLANSRILNAGAASLDYVPFSGRIGTEARMNDQIKKALSNTFGENTGHLTKDFLAKTQAKLGQGFDDFLTKNNLVVDQQLKSELYKKLELAKREMGNDSRYRSLKNQVDDLLAKSYSQPVSNMAQSADDIARLNASRQVNPDVVIGGAPELPQLESSKLLSEIRKLGGLSTKDMRDILGENATNLTGAQVGVFTKKGEEVGDMVRRLVDRGVMPKQVLNDVDGGAQALRDAIQKRLTFGGDDMAMRAAAESYYGAPEVLPGAFKKGVSSAPNALPYEMSNEIYGAAAYDTKKTLDRMARATDTSLAHHAKQIRESIMDGVSRSVGPDKAKEFLALKRKYANLKSLERLAGNSAEGDISMARLGNIDSRNKEVSELAKIAATFAKGRESPHGAMQRVSIGAGVTALGGGAVMGLAAPVAAGLTAGRLANTALNSNTLRNMLISGQVPNNRLSYLLADPAIRAGLLAAQSK